MIPRKKRYWLQALTILWGQFSSFCLFLGISFFLINSLSARQTIEFGQEKPIQVISDKAYRLSKKNMFEAIGNVIITQGENTIYGEKASLSFLTGDVDVLGNVRYIGPRITLYGSHLEYNFKTKYLSLNNSRIISENFVVLGKKISRIDEKTIIGEDAEYTTCRDCPESWSIFGKDIKITLGEYIYIKHALVKIKGVVLFYIPYIVLPIKKERETGLLFPSFAFSVTEGFRFQQPWFWAISDSVDMTFTPSFWEKRGAGGEWEYRQAFTNKSWLEIQGMHLWDKVYEPFKDDESQSGRINFRSTNLLEYHVGTQSRINHHVSLARFKDLDVLRDYDFFVSDKVNGTEIEQYGLFEFRDPHFYTGIEAKYGQNTLYDRPNEFDDRYVQILPKVSFGITPFSLWSPRLPGLSQLNLEVEGDYTVFKQNHVQEDLYIRNANRLNFRPNLNLNYGKVGPFRANTRMTLDYQQYDFPQEQEQKTFSKIGYLTESELSLSLFKVYGVAYREKVSYSEIKRDKEKVQDVQKKKGKDDGLIAYLPPIENSIVKDEVLLTQSSIKHNQRVGLRHYQLFDQTVRGNEKFAGQILTEDGLFDHWDAPREKEFEFNVESATSSLPLKNTVEFFWNHSMIKKTPKASYRLYDHKLLWDHFNYSKVGYFDISQGYDFSSGSSDVIDHLTRLHIATGLTFRQISFSVSEIYYYRTNGHIINFQWSGNFKRFKISNTFRYDSFSEPVSKDLIFDGLLHLNDLLSFGLILDFDIAEKKTERTIYRALYTPVNNCWKVDVKHERNRAENRWSVNFLVNFSNNNFTSLSEH